MLDTDTKRRIDTARDILVGKVPDPKSQVEQITIALIYKFMDDMDAEAEELGGKRKFFTGDFARYGWAKLMRSGLGGHETLNLYAEGIGKMPENPGIPLLFRDIFKNAYLPYRDPETLKSFLKVIDEFTYDHSERLGDAFEYLLSVLGSQGDAGQFRTPRHIIDFMVEIVDPRKTETVLDPACGTAGFLISSYKHILKANTDDKANSTLTPHDKGRLAQNFKGYDISPDMVRLSLVNLYLHGFADPHIYEYDSLTSQDRWNEYADVILANPPFMSPKGGIKPHNRFSVQSKRSEVLFVDYIAEHLTPNGRAGIIVPDGIIFQSQTAYADLRKMLVESYLVVVVSLPAGVFNPYSGVKTSILILDKSLAKKANTIAFFKIENDGFGLGAQRREIDKNDLPHTLAEIKEYLRLLRAGESVAAFHPRLGLTVEKDKIVANGEYNLSRERYRVGIEKATKFPKLPLKDICTFIADGDWIESKDQSSDGIRLIQTGNVGIGEYLDRGDKARYISEETFARLQCTEVFEGDILVSRLPDPIGRACILPSLRSRAITAVDCSIIRFDPHRFISNLFPYYTRSNTYYRQLDAFLTGASRSRISRKNLEAIEIPIPPLSVQKEIVTELDGYQRIVDGARAVLHNYRPHILVHPDWPLMRLIEIANAITDGTHFTPTYTESGVPFLRVTDITQSNSSKKFISREEHSELIKRCHPEKGDVLYTKNGTIGVAKVVDWDFEFSIFVSLCLIKPKHELIDSHYLECFLNSDTAYAQAQSRSKSGTVTNLHLIDIKTIQIPVPPLYEQQQVVAEIEAEQALVSANRELISRFERKIQTTLARVWDEEVHATASPL
jgi:type I restriction enzyme M protein